MSDEDAFLTGIAADRADRTRLLVFADWLADHADPREEFVRLHARLLDMDDTEPEFEKYDKAWRLWTRAPVRLDCMPQAATDRLPACWLDAICRLWSESDIHDAVLNGTRTETPEVECVEYSFVDHDSEHAFDSIVLYHAEAAEFASPLAFAAATVANDIRDNEFFRSDQPLLGWSYPVTRGTFWRRWRERCAALRPPSLPRIPPDNLFTGAQLVSGGWCYWAAVAAYQRDYFALFWSTTD